MTCTPTDKGYEFSGELGSTWEVALGVDDETLSRCLEFIENKPEGYYRRLTIECREKLMTMRQMMSE